MYPHPSPPSLPLSLQSNTLGVIKPGDSFCYVEEVKNESGVWVNLSPDSLQQLSCSSVQGFALGYSAEKKEEYLVEKEVHVLLSASLLATLTLIKSYFLLSREIYTCRYIYIYTSVCFESIALSCSLLSR